MIVLDASAAVELVLNTKTGVRVADRISDVDETLHAPHLVDLEVTQSLRRFALVGAITERFARAALADFGELDVIRYPHEGLLRRVWQLRDNLSAYDAAYVALAEVLGAVLLTTDTRISAATGHTATVEMA